MTARGMRGLALVAGVVVVVLLSAAPAGARLLEPPGNRLFFGVSDTGDSAQFGEFSAAVATHPAVIESFRSWGSGFQQMIHRWQVARARPMIHITTAAASGGELLTPRAIAQGAGDGYLVRLNRLFWAKKMPAYVRPLGEPNRCLNVYAAYDCAGHPRRGPHGPHWYKLAFRRIYVIVHGGGKAAKINARLKQAGLPPLRSKVGGLPVAPVAVIWSPLPAGSPTVPRNRPRHFFPGSRWVDWTGTDFYASYPEWKALTGLYNRFPHKPFALTEWGMEGGDDPNFVNRLFAWVRHHPRCRMLVYYQDFGPTSSYRIQNFPQSLEALREQLSSPRFAAFAPGAPQPPPGGLEPAVP